MADPTQITQQQVGFAPEVAPYAQDLLGRAAAMQDIPYQAYEGDQVAQFSPLQQQSYDYASQLTSAPQMQDATAMAGLAGLGGLNTQYTFNPATNAFNAPATYVAGTFGPPNVSAQSLQQYQMGPAQQVGTTNFTDARIAQQYMSPYMQNVTDVQMQQAKRQADIAAQTQQAQAARSGAFGGGRDAVMRSLGSAELQRNLANIQATGLQNAYAQGMQQFTADQQRQLQAALANQQAGMTTEQQNLAARLGVQQLGSQQGLQAALANQQAQLAAQQAAEQSRQYGYGQQMQAAGLGAQYGMAANQLNAQQQQFGASLGMQGLQTALSGAQQLGNLGQTQYAQNVGLVNLQNQLGLQQQQQAQNVLNTQYQNYLNQQNYPYKQMGFMSDILRGVPLTTTGSTVYQAAPSALQSLTSLGLGAYGLSSLFGGTGTGQAAKAAGGSVKGYAGGGSVTSREFKEYAVDNVPSQMLPIVQRNAQGRGDMDTYQLAMEKMAQDAAIRRGVAGALPAGASVVRAAGGGILAFAGDEDDNDPQTGQLVNFPQMGPADPRRVQAADKAIAEMMGFEPSSLTADESNTLWQGYFDRAKKALGPNEAAEGLRKYYAGAEDERMQALAQGKGLAALEAAGAILQPGGFMRGLGAAGSAFAKSYGQSLRADAAAKRSNAIAQYHLADSERKERAGLMKEADTALAAYKANKKDADKFEFDKRRYAADANVKLVRETRQLKGAGAGAGPKPLKINEQLAAAETAYENDPSEKNLKNVTALRRAVAQTKTTDVGTTKADLTREGRISSEDKSVQAAMKSFKYDPAYLEAKQAGPDEAERVWNAELARQRSIYRGPAGGGAGEQKSPKGDKVPRVIKLD